VVAHTFNPSTQEARGRRISEFEASLVYKVSSRTDRQGYTEKPCLEKPKKKQKTQNHNAVIIIYNIITLLLFYYARRANTVATKSYELEEKYTQNFSPDT
jgi:predicted porin